MSGMAEVLAKRNFEKEWGAGEWAQLSDDIKLGWLMEAQETIEFLTAAGFGPVKEAKAQALEEAAAELTRLPYVKPGAEGREDYERVLAVRRGDTDKWLRARAAAVRGDG